MNVLPKNIIYRLKKPFKANIIKSFGAILLTESMAIGFGKLYNIDWTTLVIAAIAGIAIIIIGEYYMYGANKAPAKVNKTWNIKSSSTR